MDLQPDFGCFHPLLWYHALPTTSNIISDVKIQLPELFAVCRSREHSVFLRLGVHVSALTTRPTSQHSCPKLHYNCKQKLVILVPKLQLHIWIILPSSSRQTCAQRLVLNSEDDGNRVCNQQVQATSKSQQEIARKAYLAEDSTKRLAAWKSRPCQACRSQTATSKLAQNQSMISTHS